MNDPMPPHRTQVGWPPVAVPGQGRLSRDTVPIAEAGTAASETGDGPHGEAVPQTPVVGDRPAASPEEEQASGLGTGDESGTGPQAAVAPGQRSPASGHPGTGPDTGTGPVVSRGPEGRVGPDSSAGPASRGDQAVSEGAELLSELRAAVSRYVVLPSDEALTAVTLWVASTHLQPVLQHAPRLAIVGPTKGCGKSRLLDVITETVHRPMITVNTSPAVVYRVIGKNPPTLLVDEADTIFGPKAGDKEDLRGLLNAGHQRNRPAWRISGPEHKPT